MTKARVRLRNGDRVVAAGLLGTVVEADAGTTDGHRICGGQDPLAEVRWDGEPETATVRTRLLTKVAKRRAKR